MDNFLAEIRIFPYSSRIPSGWVPCNGQLMQVATNQALYAIIGNVYGGTQGQNFNLPNLNGRVIVGTVTNSSTLGGLTPYQIGNTGGAEAVTVLASQIPAHTHNFNINQTYDIGSPNTNYLGNPNTPTSSSQPGQNKKNSLLYINSDTNPAPVALAPSISSTGGSAAHENRMPYMPFIVCIATMGIFPPRQ